MQNVIFSINVVIPIFAVMFLGLFLRRKNILNDNFADVSSVLSFKVASPAMLFDEISSTDLSGVLDIKLIIFDMGATLAVFIISSLIVRLLVRDGRTRGAMVQGIFRSNFAILGLALANNALGQVGFTKSAVLMVFTIPLFNVLAVITLTVNSPSNKDVSFKGILLNIVKNPLIIAIILALPFSYFQISLPVVLDKVIGYMSSLAIPLALLGMGCSFNFKATKGCFKASLVTSMARILLVPLIVVPAAYFIGFRGADIGVLFFLFASPAAVSSYVMSKAMDCDADLSASVILMTTLGSVITLSAGIYILKAIGLI